MSFPGLLAVADRAALAHLGGAIRYRPRDSAEIEVPGIFDAVYVRADAGTPGVSSSGPAVFVRLEDLPIDPEDDDPIVTVDGASYMVRDIQKDGQGGVMLFLKREG